MLCYSIAMKRSDFIAKTKRIVVKVGTSILTTDTGRLHDEKISALVDQLANLADDGYEVIVVSSGSIAAGLEPLGFKAVPKLIPQMQAAASVGQGLLVHKYSDLFKQKGITVGQVLVTRADTTHRQQYVNCKNTLNKLIDLKVVPIINENDSTAIDEIKFGDNDTLAALICNIVEADLLVILSDVDGLFSADPKSGQGKLIARVDDITEEIEAIAGGSGTSFGKGGMETKVRAAKMATAGRSGVIIANGHKQNTLLDIVKGVDVGTFFVPSKEKISSRKLWIKNQPSKGIIYIDSGANKALLNGSSLLAAGIVGTQSDFEIGEVISIKFSDEQKNEIRGITNYSSKEIKLILGKKYSKDGDLPEEVVHRDDMVIT